MNNDTCLGQRDLEGNLNIEEAGMDNTEQTEAVDGAADILDDN